MRLFMTGLAVVNCLLPAAASADPPPASGKFLVATELVHGEVFAETVILLIHYDETGAMGIVINRPTDVSLEEVVEDVDAFAAYNGSLYWGGPVQMSGLRALMHTDTPPEGATKIVDRIHHVHIDKELLNAPAGPATLRFFIGYAGWGAGQLDGELARGSWHVVPASAENVFAEEPQKLWKRLSPRREYRAANR